MKFNLCLVMAHAALLGPGLTADVRAVSVAQEANLIFENTQVDPSGNLILTPKSTLVITLTESLAAVGAQTPRVKFTLSDGKASAVFKPKALEFRGSVPVLVCESGHAFSVGFIDADPWCFAIVTDTEIDTIKQHTKEELASTYIDSQSLDVFYKLLQTDATEWVQKQLQLAENNPPSSRDVMIDSIKKLVIHPFLKMPVQANPAASSASDQKQNVFAGCTNEPVTPNVFLRSQDNQPSGSNVITQFSGDAKAQSWEIKCSDALYQKIILAAAEAGILQTNKTQLITKKFNESPLRPCRPTINGVFIPALALNTESTLPAESITEIGFGSSGAATLYVLNVGSATSSVLFKDEMFSDSIEIVPNGERLMVISHLAGAYRVHIIERSAEPDGTAVQSVPNASHRQTTTESTQPATDSVPPDMAPAAKSARLLFDQGKYDEAAGQYQQIISRYPDNLYALSNLGVVRFQQGKFKDAEVALRRATEIAPNDGFSQAMLGIVFYMTGRIDDAITTLTQAAKLDPNDPQTHNYLGIASSRKGLHQVAEQEVRKAIELNPNYGDAHFNLAVIYATQNPPAREQARRHYDTALQLGLGRNPELEKLMK